jgi:glucose/arabinose dehydrogenase
MGPAEGYELNRIQRGKNYGYPIVSNGDGAREVERYDMGARIRSVVEGPEGALWVLEDDEEDSTGRLLKLTPKR